MKKSCRTCAHWDADTARDTAGRIRSDRGAPCLYATPPLPACMGFRKTTGPIEPHRTWMAADSGQNCQTYEKRAAE